MIKLGTELEGLERLKIQRTKIEKLESERLAREKLKTTKIIMLEIERIKFYSKRGIKKIKLQCYDDEG